MKYARVIEAYAGKTGCTLDEALDRFYRSKTYQLLRDGVSDLHCMSDDYLAEELRDEFASPGVPPPLPPPEVPRDCHR